MIWYLFGLLKVVPYVGQAIDAIKLAVGIAKVAQEIEKKVTKKIEVTAIIEEDISDKPNP